MSRIVGGPAGTGSMLLRGAFVLVACAAVSALFVLSLAPAHAAGAVPAPVCGVRLGLAGAQSATQTTATTRGSRCITLARLARSARSSRVNAARVTNGVISKGVGVVTRGVGSILGDTESALAGASLSVVASWVTSGARKAVQEAAHVIGAVTAPQLTSAWFSTTYWRVAGLGALLTIPFLFAAAVQAVAHGDLALLGRAALGHLPVAVLGVSLAAPVVMLLLAATDEMCAVVSGASGVTSTAFLDRVAGVVGDLTVAGGSFFVVVVAVLAALAALLLTLEMLIRAAAVYVVVLMLPLAFAALVWPARRQLVVRMVELLLGLILSKFVIVAILTLAGAAIVNTAPKGEVATTLAGMALLLLSVCAPWTLMRLLPFTEVAASAGGMLRAEAQRALPKWPDGQPQQDPGDALLDAERERASAPPAQPATDEDGAAERMLARATGGSSGPPAGGSAGGPRDGGPRDGSPLDGGRRDGGSGGAGTGKGAVADGGWLGGALPALNAPGISSASGGATPADGAAPNLTTPPSGPTAADRPLADPNADPGERRLPPLRLTDPRRRYDLERDDLGGLLAIGEHPAEGNSPPPSDPPGRSRDPGENLL